jgi:hypothetical protein
MSSFGKLFNVFSMISDIGRGFEEIGQGIDELVTEVPVGVYHAILDGSEFLQYIGVFLFTNFVCMMKNMKNMTSCIFFYIFDAILLLCYLPIAIFLFLFSFIFPSIYDMQKKVFEYAEKIDKYWFGFFKFHLIHYPKSVRDMCYNCKRLKPTVFVNKIMEYADDISDPIYGDLTNWASNVLGGTYKVLNAVIGF